MAHWDFAKGVKDREILDLPVLSPAFQMGDTLWKTFHPAGGKTSPAPQL
jgi:hypothetical protein